MNSVLSIVGPTASGKTEVSIAIAQRFAAPVISADSVQMFRGLDIGSGKVRPDEMGGVPHYMLDAVDPDTVFSAADFASEADALIGKLHETHPLVLTVGGSGFYLQALLEGLDAMPEIPESVRIAVRADFERQGLAPLLLELEAVDAATFATIDRQNPVRVCRALEVYRACGKPISEFRKGRAGEGKPWRQAMIGIQVDRAVLNARIDARVDDMMKRGWLDEVAGLMARYPADCPGLGALGYRELVGHVQGKTTLAEAVALIKLHTHQFAKRQMTWFKRYPEIKWFGLGEKERMLAFAEEWMRDPVRC